MDTTECLSGHGYALASGYHWKSLYLCHVTFTDVVTVKKDGQMARGNAEEAPPKI